VVTDRPEVAAAVTAALAARSVASRVLDPPAATGFAEAHGALVASVERDGPVDAVVVALGEPAPGGAPPHGWEAVLAAHGGLPGRIHADAAWARAVADHSAAADRPVRLVTATEATSPSGRSRAQASAQLARSARRATDDRVAAFAVSQESATPADTGALGELVAHLVCSPASPALSGAELVVGDGWVGLRSHPRPRGSISLGGPELPGWLDDALGAILGARRA
jgi:hypothetical protein